MKSIFGWVLIFAVILSCSCSSPLRKNTKIENKVAVTENKIEDVKDQQVEKAKGYIFGADYALGLDLNPSKYSKVAKDFTERGIVTIGSPEMNEVIVLRQIVDNLVSTNQALVIKGEKALLAKDKEVIDLQEQKKELESKLEKSESQRKEIAAENASYASKWVAIKRFFLWGVYIVIGGLILSILGQVLPPPYNSIASIIAIPVGLIIKLIHGLIPSAKNVAGVVASTTYTETEKALKQIVEGIQELKNNDKDAFEKNVKPFLKESTDTDARQTIIKKLQELGYK